MNWNWDHIRFFLALAEQNTLTNAAKELDVSHSTVLRRISQFEAELKTRLFEQQPSGYQLTEAGQELYTQCADIRQRLQKALHRAADSDHRLAGEITITTSDSLAQYLLPPALNNIQKLHPDLRFNLQMDNRVSNLNDRESDIAVRPCQSPPEHLIGRKVGAISFVAAASENYLQTNNLQDAPLNDAGHKAIVLDDSYANMPFHTLFLKQLHEGASRTTVNNFTNATAMARADMGVTVLPKYILQYERELLSVPHQKQLPASDLWILSHTDLRRTERIKLVKKLLLKELQTGLRQA